MSDYLPAPREPNNLEEARRNWLVRVVGELIKYIQATPQPLSPRDPMIIDAEFEIKSADPPPPSYPPYRWELTPDELRQIRKWKGIDDDT